MKKLIGLALLLVLVSLALAQKTQETRKSPLQSMVDTELAFAKMALDQNTRTAFVTFIADDGILFRPRPVIGKQWFAEHPVPPSDKRPLLSWYPAIADMSLAGDMGYTTGPWEFKANINDAAPVAFGNFLTVWKRQKDGSWKFAIDLGISNPKPDQVAAAWQQPATHKQPKIGVVGPDSVKTDAAALLAREREFSNASTTLGAAKAFAAFAGNNVRVFRNEKQPMGKADAESELLANPLGWTWEPVFADVSAAGDLGYSYGTYRLTKKDAVEAGNYYRIWKREGGAWKVVADLLDPVPEEKKN